MPEMVEIEKVELKRLKRDAAFLEALQAAGVDNWEGYSEAIKILHEDHPEYNDDAQ